MVAIGDAAGSGPRDKAGAAGVDKGGGGGVAPTGTGSSPSRRSRQDGTSKNRISSATGAAAMTQTRRESRRCSGLPGKAVDLVFREHGAGRLGGVEDAQHPRFSGLVAALLEPEYDV